MAFASTAIACVALLQLAAFAWYVPGNDWARDLFMAARIADGGAWPSRGPVIGGLFHTGPLWYFVVALPLALGAGFTATTLFVGALATAKIPLAARFGFRLGGPRLALAFAALVAVPGWNLFESLQLTHTAVLQTLAIASMLPLLTLWRGGAPWHWLAFGALTGLAVQSHPVAGVLVFAALVVAWRRRARWRGDLPAIAAGLVLATLPALPMLLAEAREGWPSLSAIANAPAPGPRAMAAEAVATFAALTIGAVRVQHDWVPPGWAPLVAAAGAVLATAWLASLPRLRRAPGAWRRAGLGALAFVVAGTWLLLVRERVPFYMAAIATPALAFVLAQGLAAARRVMFAAGVGASLVLAAVAPLSVIATMRDGHAAFALGSIHDIRAVAPPRVPLALLPMWAFDALAKRACGHAELRVHGELGALVDFYQGLPFSRACDSPVRLRLGGMTGGADVFDWAGATPHTLRVLGDPSPSWGRAFALAPRRVVAPSAPVDVAADARYPHRPGCVGEATAHQTDVVTTAGEALALHSPLFAFDRFAIVDATRDGRPVEPASRTNAGAIYLPAGNRATHAWRVRYVACDDAAVNVITLPATW